MSGGNGAGGNRADCELVGLVQVVADAWKVSKENALIYCGVGLDITSECRKLQTFTLCEMDVTIPYIIKVLRGSNEQIIRKRGKILH